MGRRPVLVGVDVGTSRVKAVAFDLAGHALALADRPTPWIRALGLTDMDPRELAKTVRDVAGRVCLAIDDCGIVGLGVTGMAEAGVLLDGADRPLAPILAWHDPRGDVETVSREIGAETFQRTVGMPLDAQPSLAKILWLRQHQPETRCAVRYLSVPEWVVFSLGGSPVSELSLASRTGLLDIASAAPWPAAEALLERNLLSELVIAGAPAGPAVGPDLPAPLRGAALTVAGHDHQTAAFAVGAVRPGYLLDSLGTAEALVRCVEGPLEPAIVGRLAAQRITTGLGVVQERYSVLAGLRTGLMLEQIARMIGADSREARIALGEAALGVDLLGLPFAMRVDAEGGFLLGPIGDGLSPSVVWAAAVRDLVMLSARSAEPMTLELGPHQQVVLAGGWIRNPAVRSAKLRQYPTSTISPVDEAGAVGAALLAGVAAGVLAPALDDAPPCFREPAGAMKEVGR
jgi:sugar (pentulose or hexulose) kinase